MSERTRAEQYVGLRRAAERLGLDASQLCRMRRAHPLYEPAICGLPGVVGSRTTRFHREQLRLIEGVLVGNLDLDTAWLEWQVIRNQIGRKPALPEETQGGETQNRRPLPTPSRDPKCIATTGAPATRANPLADTFAVLGIQARRRGRRRALPPVLLRQPLGRR